jgi:hypothetical protein
MQPPRLLTRPSDQQYARVRCPYGSSGFAFRIAASEIAPSPGFVRREGTGKGGQFRISLIAGISFSLSDPDHSGTCLRKLMNLLHGFVNIDSASGALRLHDYSARR